MAREVEHANSSTLQSLAPNEREDYFTMARLLLIVLSLSVFATVACDEQDDNPFPFMHCLFVKTGCDEAKIAQLQMQVAAYVATIDEKEASGLGGISGLPLINEQDLMSTDTTTEVVESDEE